jgi:nitrogen regulatory protein PII
LGKSRAADAENTIKESGHALAKKTKLTIVVSDELAHRVEEAIAMAAHTGRPGDGKIFVYDVNRVLKIRTGETGHAAVRWGIGVSRRPSLGFLTEKEIVDGPP